MLVLCAVGIWLWWSDHHSTEAPKAPLTFKPPLTNTIASPLPTETNPPAQLARKPIVPLAAPSLPTLTNTSPPSPTRLPSGEYPRSPRDILEGQIALARFGISPGSIDGAIGSQTRAALAAFQGKSGIPATGELDLATRTRLALLGEPLTGYIVTSNDLSRLQPISKTWLEKSQQTALDYENILELLAERGHASPNLIRRLNPSVNWSNVVAGTEVSMPKADYPKASMKAAFIIISLAQKHLEVFDIETNLVAHFPCSIAARVEKRPVGELHVATVAHAPDYTFNPEVFPESEEGRRLGRKLILPPGPNNPVGSAWVGLDKSGYGMHGTPSPEQVGRTESHGCFRLANWNADYLAKVVWIGLPVRVVP